MTANVPLNLIHIGKPADMPCVEDWVTCCISYLFNGSRLYREPLDLNMNSIPTSDPDEPVLHVKKGFTRLTLG